MPRSHFVSDGRVHRAAAVHSSLEPGSPATADRVSHSGVKLPRLLQLPGMRSARPTARSDSPTDKAAEVGPHRPTGPRLRSTSAEPGRRPLPVVVEIFRPRPSPIARRGPLARVSRFGSQRVAVALFENLASHPARDQAQRRSVNAMSVSVARLTRRECRTRVAGAIQQCYPPPRDELPADPFELTP